MSETLTDEQKADIKAKADELITDLANDLRPMVEEIEASVAITENRYDKYMGILDLMGAGDPAAIGIISLALLEAGANKQGVEAAMSQVLPR